MENELLKKDKKLSKLNKIKNIILIISIIYAIICLILIVIIDELYKLIFLATLIPAILTYPIIYSIYQDKYNKLYKKIEISILNEIGISHWKYTTNRDEYISVKSKQAILNYNDIKYFREQTYFLERATSIINDKEIYEKKLTTFLKSNNYKELSMYPIFKSKIEYNICYTGNFYVLVSYISPAGRSNCSVTLSIPRRRIIQLNNDKSLLMSKSEYSKYIKDYERELLEKKKLDHYNKVNEIIDKANKKDEIIIKDDLVELDKLIASLFDRTINSIVKIKSTNSEEWNMIDSLINNIEVEVNKIISKNKQINNYYNSNDFKKIKSACENLMIEQKDFNEYIDDKVNSLTNLFGTRVIRNETENIDEYNYIHPYKKNINPFIAELSSSVFSSAENNPLDYVIKYFYPNKDKYPEQIQKLHLLIEELETLKDAKTIIDNHKKEVQNFITNIPSYVMNNDETGFYSRLGFATIDEKKLTIEYKFSYTSDGGKAHRDFTIPMTEDTIVSLISSLENKLTFSAFSKEQRALMTNKLRHNILERDKYTCKYCGNSNTKEPNLLLEIDHIIPIAKGGITEENNLQTLCWKCNRSKGSKLL